jgi:large subunit ribosomal protein L21e
MPERKGGNRRKTKSKFTKELRQKGKISLTKFFQEFKVGQKVVLLVESGYQRGMYHRKFYSKDGIVSGKQGKCYLVDIVDGRVAKTVIVHPVHVKKVAEK